MFKPEPAEDFVDKVPGGLFAVPAARTGRLAIHAIFTYTGIYAFVVAHITVIHGSRLTPPIL